MTLMDKPSLLDRLRQSEVGRSIWRTTDRVTPRDRAAAHWSSFFLHIYPVKMRREEIMIRYSWYLGAISTVLFGSLVVSGIYLMFFYVPSPGQAYTDIQTIQTEVAFGQYIRNVHRWSAHLMVLAVAAHMARVFYRGAYKKPKEFNWVIGVVLLLLTLLLSFTGYLLPWDQLAIWAITVGSNMARATPLLGAEGPGAALLSIGGTKLIHVGSDARFALIAGRTIGGGTLIRFYVLHCVGIPIVAAWLMAVHFWRVRRDGGISGPM